MSAYLKIKGAAAFGVNLSIDDDDLVYDSRHEVAPSVLEKIAAHEHEIVAALKTCWEAIAAIWPQVQDLDLEQLAAFKNAKAEEIEILQAALAALEGASAAILPAMKANACTWGRAVSFLLEHPSNARYAKRRPNGYSDEEWIQAVNRARDLGLKPPLEKKRVAS